MINCCVDRYLNKQNVFELATLKGKYWPIDYNLKICFIDGDEVVKEKVKNIAQIWTRYANIKFNFTNDQQNSDIRIGFLPGGSWSYIGTDAKQINKFYSTMNFGWLYPFTPEEEYLRVVLHEFGHALGAIHEHQNPSANIPWNREKVYRYFSGPPNYWDRSTIDRNIFEKYSDEQTQYSEFDKNSIMLYSISKELTDGVFEIGWNSKLSEIDKYFIGKIYPKVVSGTSKFISKLYELILNRKPSNEEVDWWIEIAKTESRHKIANKFEYSLEWYKNTGWSYYYKFLGRYPEVGENYWTETKKYSEEELMSIFLSSVEYRSKYKFSDTEWLIGLYKLLLNRHPSNLEIKAQLNSNLRDKDVVINMLSSHEYRTRQIHSYYFNLLSRQPAQLEVDKWVNSQYKLKDIKVYFYSSPEFFNKWA